MLASLASQLAPESRLYLSVVRITGGYHTCLAVRWLASRNPNSEFVPVWLVLYPLSHLSQISLSKSFL